MVEGVEGQHNVRHCIIHWQVLGRAQPELDPRRSWMTSDPRPGELDHSRDWINADKAALGNPGCGVPQGRTGTAANVDDQRVGLEFQGLHGKSVRGVLTVVSCVPLSGLGIPLGHQMGLTSSSIYKK
jgi:hypothetical protein